MTGLDDLEEVVAPAILRRAGRVSSLLRELGVPHALIGGLAVGVHGHPRATRDVDFLVGAEAFSHTTPVLMYRQELAEIVRTGETDIMSIPTDYPGLAAELRLEDDIPVISLRGLILMKLVAFRPRDQGDVGSLVRQSPERLREIRDHVAEQGAEHGPHLVVRLAEVLGS